MDIAIVYSFGKYAVCLPSIAPPITVNFDTHQNQRRDQDMYRQEDAYAIRSSRTYCGKQSLCLAFPDLAHPRANGRADQPKHDRSHI